MKIKRQIIWALIGEVDPNILFERIKKLYPNTKYFNPLDPNYNGNGFRQLLYDKMLEEIQIFNCNRLYMSIYEHFFEKKCRLSTVRPRL